MSEFLSWIEKDGKVFFLTGEQIKSERGAALIEKQCGFDDYTGHGAIRLFYGLEQDEGEEKECTNLSAPKNFPEVISTAIKAGKFRGFPFPSGLLHKLLDDDFDVKLKLLNNDLDVKHKLNYDDYLVKRKLLDGYVVRCKLLDDLAVKHKLSYDDYLVKRKLLDDDYWDLFAIQENRTPAWRDKEDKMATTKWKCPKHNKALRTIEDYPGALVHTGCPSLFTTIDGNLCILGGQFGDSKWYDTKTGEVRNPKP